MLIRRLSAVVVASLSLCTWAESFDVSKKLLDVKDRPAFQKHEDRLILPLPSSSIEDLRKLVDKKIAKNLMMKSAPHIAVITPGEWRVLSQFLKMETIEKIALEENLMQSKIEIECLKKIVLTKGDKFDEAWFIAAKSPELLAIRKQIWRKFVVKGGSPDDFQPKRWSPAITVGCTAPEMFDEDETAREKAECAFELKQI